MPFGLATAPTTFQQAMELALAGLTYSICLCYLDDIIIFSDSIAEHCNRLRAVLTRFRQGCQDTTAVLLRIMPLFQRLLLN